MSQNAEIDAKALRRFVLQTLQEKHGWISHSELERLVQEEFQLSERDREFIVRKGKPTKIRRWQNRIDWAKAHLRRKGIAYSTPNIKGEQYLFAPEFQRPKASFRKACGTCGRKRIVLSAKICPRCKTAFPPDPPRHSNRRQAAAAILVEIVEDGEVKYALAKKP